MRGLPSGTVTFLFTDIEGSTRLLEELGAERYAEVLAEHRLLCREAFSAHDGVEVDTQGDAFFVAFPSAGGALAAAFDAQVVLAGGPIRVRMGVHTGEPLLASGDYVGMDVHRAARIAAAGHGGQVLVSSATAGLVGRDGLVDLGEHRFKDLAAPERVFQLGRGEFPPLKSLYRTNLPVPATSFLGREAEVEAVLALLVDPRVRLITLTGPGGTGKTRLSLQVAAEASDAFPDGVWWVPLAPLRDPSLILSAVAQAVEVTEAPGRELGDSLAAALAGKRALILLDNAEHLMAEAAAAVAGLRDAGGPKLLVTSRERLQLAGERVHPVPTLAERDGIALFVARARELDAGFTETAAVSELCSRLDRLPLALELAAARTTLFSPEQLLERLGQRLDLLKGGRDADPRQHTLRATIEWSHDLLDEEDKRLFACLSVFAGGCTYQAAEQVADADPDTLQSLLDKNLLRRRDGVAGEPRYWMLETIRQYAREQLEATGEGSLVEARLVEMALEFAVCAQPAWRMGGTDEWLRRFEDELDNLRHAIRVAVDCDEGVRVLTIAANLSWLWQTRGLLREGREWIELAQAAAGELEPGLEGLAYLVDGLLAGEQGNTSDFERLLRQSLPLLAASGRAHDHAFALSNLGRSIAERNPEEAEQLLRQSLSEAQQLTDTTLIGMTTSGLALCAAVRGDREGAQKLLEQVVALSRANPTNPAHRATDLTNLAGFLVAGGEPRRPIWTLGSERSTRSCVTDSTSRRRAGTGTSASICTTVTASYARSRAARSARSGST